MLSELEHNLRSSFGRPFNPSATGLISLASMAKSSSATPSFPTSPRRSSSNAQRRSSPSCDYMNNTLKPHFDVEASLTLRIKKKVVDDLIGCLFFDDEGKDESKAQALETFQTVEEDDKHRGRDKFNQDIPPGDRILITCGFVQHDF